VKTPLLLLPALLLILLAGILIDAWGAMDMSILRQHQEDILRWRDTHPLALASAFFCLQVLMAAFALPGSSLLLLAAGAAYGLLAGTLLCLSACTLGAMLTMLYSRHFLRDSVVRRYAGRLAQLDAGFARDGVLYLFSLRMLPAIPFIVVNLLAGLSRMKAWTFFWVSFAGMLASTLVYVNAGVELVRAGSLQGLLSPGLLAALAAAGLLPLLSKRLFERRLAPARVRSLR